jgi:hypothetical protein
MSTATFARLRVSLKMVAYCSPELMALTESSSASWPEMIGHSAPTV